MLGCAARVFHTAHSLDDGGGGPLFDDQMGLFSIDKNSLYGPRGWAHPLGEEWRWPEGGDRDLGR